MDECIASDKTLIEPVSIPAISFNTISDEFDAIESNAALLLFILKPPDKMQVVIL